MSNQRKTNTESPTIEKLKPKALFKFSMFVVSYTSAYRIMTSQPNTSLLQPLSKTPQNTVFLREATFQYCCLHYALTYCKE